MDPLTQGVVGAVASQQPANRKNILVATILGFLSGLAPDLDIFIRSDKDPLLVLEFHRQFTHSLVFIPIGGLICATVFYYLFTKRNGFTFRKTYIFSTLGYATHGLLDSCTSYGTQLFWPFTDSRISWNTISIVDPLFTIPLLILILFTVIKNNKIFSRLALSWIVIYCIFGFIQQDRAKDIAKKIALSRGHIATNVLVKPSLANLFVWKIIYSTDNYYYVDAVKIALKSKMYKGSKINKLNVEESFPWLDLNSQQAKDLERFRWFSGDYLAISKKYPNRVIDIRYSILTNESNGLWGIELDKKADENSHIKYIFNRERNSDTINILWNMIIK